MSDLIAYEAASAADMVDEGMERRGWDWTAEHLDKTIINICEACGVQSPAYIFLTGTGNFRFDIATVKPYKERNLSTYLMYVCIYRLNTEL